MFALRRLAGLSWRERLLLLRALWCLGQAMVAVRLLPYSRLRAQTQAEPSCSASASPYATAELIAWAIECVAQRLPGMTCLIKALAGRSLLARYGYPATLRIGIKRDAAGQFTSHAWLEQNGCAVLGGRTAPLEYIVMDIPVGSVGGSCTPPQRSKP